MTDLALVRKNRGRKDFGVVFVATLSLGNPVNTLGLSFIWGGGERCLCPCLMSCLLFTMVEIFLCLFVPARHPRFVTLAIPRDLK